MPTPSSTYSSPSKTDRLGQVIGQRRAVRHFRSQPIENADLDAILEMAGQAPSGYNLQPWRFVVVRDPANLKRLRQAAMDQEKITEASAVVVAFAMRDSWSEYADEILATSATNGAIPDDNLPEQKRKALAFVDSLPIAVWLNRHVMIAFTCMMLAAESLGWDTAPMEGFDPAAVRSALGLPGDAEVVALLAIGVEGEPPAPHPGRLPLRKIVFEERFGRPWSPSPDA